MRKAAREQGPANAEERAAQLNRLERALVLRKDAVAEAASRDFGSRAKQESLIVDVYSVLTAIRHARAHLRDWMRSEPRESGWIFAPATSEIVPQPLGVVGIISPWNYPVQLALLPLVSATAAGNRAMIKPSELAPHAADVLRDILSDAFADDRVAVVQGGVNVAEAFARLPFDHLVFTGSARVGKMVMRAASENLVPITLELGGKSPAIVGPESSMRTSARCIMTGKLFNGGQTCVAPDYALVPAAARDEFVRHCTRAVTRLYPTLKANRDYTAIVNEAHYERLRSCVRDAKAQGATVIEINPAAEELDPTERKIAPTLVLDPKHSMLCVEEEIFGPVLPVVTYERFDQAIAYVNDRPRPLALYYFGDDTTAIERVLAETTSGGVTINETMLHALQDDLPFGGVGASGMGHYHGREGFDAFSKRKPVFRQSRLTATALLRPPYGRLADRLLRFLIGG
jgi:acyl-CoA reductase-like NAD-dependent aldehyde dehydrogenase